MPVLQSQLQIMISRKSQGCMQSLPGEAPRFKLGHNMNPAGSFRWILLLMDSAKNKQRFFPHFTFEIPSKPMSWIFKRLFISFCSVSRRNFKRFVPGDSVYKGTVQRCHRSSHLDAVTSCSAIIAAGHWIMNCDLESLFLRCTKSENVVRT